MTSQSLQCKRAIRPLQSLSFVEELRVILTSRPPISGKITVILRGRFLRRFPLSRRCGQKAQTITVLYIPPPSKIDYEYSADPPLLGCVHYIFVFVFIFCFCVLI